MKTLIIDNHTKHIEELKNVTQGVVVRKEDLSSILIDDFDLIVFSGGSDVRSVVEHSSDYMDEIYIILHSNKPILGICLGCEIIVKAFGGEVKFLNREHKGFLNLKSGDTELNKILNKEIKIYEAHCAGVDKIPDNFSVLASGEHGPEIIKHKTKPILGIQFHPEVEASKELWDWILKQVLL